ncbi:MAG: hypothetical protein MSC31_02200 [Solirubrobacteraceae bacterium MAG38_C4-C5]|nr:hypothetical protein [Candidatus Siliceabacter maunaloa]
MRLRRPVLLLLVALAAMALAACGRPDQVLEAETEGLYVDLSELQYQVQVSRQLNPSDPADQPYLSGLPAGRQDLEPGEAWFAIFLRANNPSDQPQPTATEFEVLDSQENEFFPLPLGPENQFDWPVEEPVLVAPGDVFPPVGSPADEGPIGGALILFKVPISSLQNRPFELIIEGPETDPVEAEISLDV